MPMIDLPKPTQGELENIETQMRLEALTTKIEPKSVKDAKTPEAIMNAWKGEALRFWYLVKMAERRGKKL